MFRTKTGEANGPLQPKRNHKTRASDIKLPVVFCILPQNVRDFAKEPLKKKTSMKNVIKSIR